MPACGEHGIESESSQQRQDKGRKNCDDEKKNTSFHCSPVIREDGCVRLRIPTLSPENKSGLPLVEESPGGREVLESCSAARPRGTDLLDFSLGRLED